MTTLPRRLCVLGFRPHLPGLFFRNRDDRRRSVALKDFRDLDDLQAGLLFAFDRPSDPKAAAT